MTNSKKPKSSMYEAIQALENEAVIVEHGGTEYELIPPTLRKGAELQKNLGDSLQGVRQGKLGDGMHSMACIVKACLPDDCTLEMAHKLLQKTGGHKSPIYWKAFEMVGLERVGANAEDLEDVKELQGL